MPLRSRFATKLVQDEQKEDALQSVKLSPGAAVIIPGHAFATQALPIRVLYLLSVQLSYHWWWCLDSLLSLFFETTESKVEIRKLPEPMRKLLHVLKIFLLVIGLLLLTPFALLSCLIWLPLQLARPRAFAFYSGTKDSDERQHLLFTDITAYHNLPAHANSLPNRTKDEIVTTSFSRKSYALISANVCLMPEFLARLNNVSNSVQRAAKISQLICGNQLSNYKCQPFVNQARANKTLDTEMLVKTASELSVNASSVGSKFENESFFDDEVVSLDSSVESHSISSVQYSITSKEKAVSEYFPKSCDFLCLQEIFDRRAADVLLKGLKTKYPYILYDVMWPIHHGRISLLNSGLCIASKYPFLNVRFRAFPDGYREDKFACKGVLMTKVFLGENESKVPCVGYLATTHLQALTHTKASQVRCKQLDLILCWLDDFKQSTKSENEIIVFDVICGDFNFDQESHFEENERRCEFRGSYVDPCMNEYTGRQHSWVVGTELIAELLHESAVCTSSGLQRMLISELERPRYVASTAPADCVMTNASDGRRRIDYILYKPCGNKMVLKDYKFITGFATLTDHIPISMTFTTEDGQ